MSWLCSVQDDDGRVPAPRAIRDVAATSLFALSILADGSTIRGGPYRVPAKKAVRWLIDQQDEHGRIGLYTEPAWIVDHAIATYALCEAGRRAEYTLMGKRIAPAIAVLTDHLRRFDRGVPPELLAWSRMCARSAAAYELWARATDRPGAEQGYGASRLEAQVARLELTAIATDGRQRAACFLLAVLADDGVDGPDLHPLAAAFVADGWPADDDDPIAVWFGCLALYRLAGMEPQARGPVWRSVEGRLKELVVKTQVDAGDHRGSWDPRGVFGAAFGRAGTTAVQTLILTLYYRYCWLEPASR